MNIIMMELIMIKDKINLMYLKLFMNKKSPIKSSNNNLSPSYFHERKL